MGALVARRVWVAVGMIALALAPMASTGATQAATVTADKVGWWSQSQGAADPAIGTTPLGGVVPAIPSSPFVPAGSIPVAADLGEPQTEAAVGVVLDGAPPGSTVNKLTMTLQLADGNGAQQNDTQAAIVACPITSFWGESENGKWADKPEAECDTASAKGTRNDDGSWTFDLTAIASKWLDPFATIAPNGVALVEAVDPPGTFQVAFAGTDGIAFDADITPAAAGGDPFAVPSGGSAGDFGGGTSTGSYEVPSTPVPEVAAPSSPDTGRATRRPARPVAVTANRGGDVLGNLPVALVLLVPLALVLALLAGQALARGREQVASTRRQGGVGRVLSTRRTASELP